MEYTLPVYEPGEAEPICHATVDAENDADANQKALALANKLVGPGEYATEPFTSTPVSA